MVKAIGISGSKGVQFGGGDVVADVGPARARPGVRAPRRRTLAIAAVLVAGVFGAFGIGHADAPTAADIAACNREAKEGLGGRPASPTSKDEAGATAARKAGAETREGRGPTGVATESPDAQIHGMDGEGAKDAAYRAAYRVCMRQKGF